MGYGFFYLGVIRRVQVISFFNFFLKGCFFDLKVSVSSLYRVLSGTFSNLPFAILLFKRVIIFGDMLPVGAMVCTPYFLHCLSNSFNSLAFVNREVAGGDDKRTVATLSFFSFIITKSMSALRLLVFGSVAVIRPVINCLLAVAHIFVRIRSFCMFNSIQGGYL